MQMLTSVFTTEIPTQLRLDAYRAVAQAPRIAVKSYLDNDDGCLFIQAAAGARRMTSREFHQDMCDRHVNFNEGIATALMISESRVEDGIREWDDEMTDQTRQEFVQLIRAKYAQLEGADMLDDYVRFGPTAEPEEKAFSKVLTLIGMVAFALLCAGNMV